MTPFLPYALPGVVIVSLVGALVMCLLALRYAVPPDTDQDAEDFNHRLFVLRFGHAVAAFCFAVAAVLAVIAFKARPETMVAASVTTTSSGDEVARVRSEVQGLEGVLRQQLRTLEARLMAVESEAAASQERSRIAAATPPPTAPPTSPEQSRVTLPAPPTPESSRITATAPRPSRESSRVPPPAPSPQPESSRTTAAPPPPRPSPPPAVSSAPSALPAPPAVVSRPTAASIGASVSEPPRDTQLPPRRQPEPVPQPWALPRTVRVEIASDPPSPAPGQSASYTVRLIDIAGRPVVGATVSLFGRLTDGTAMQTPLEPGREPGTYYGRLDFTTLGPTDLRVRVVRREGRFEMPLSGS